MDKPAGLEKKRSGINYSDCDVADSFYQVVYKKDVVEKEELKYDEGKKTKGTFEKIDANSKTCSECDIAGSFYEVVYKKTAGEKTGQPKNPGN